MKTEPGQFNDRGKLAISGYGPKADLIPALAQAGLLEAPHPGDPRGPCELPACQFNGPLKSR